MHSAKFPGTIALTLGASGSSAVVLASTPAHRSMAAQQGFPAACMENIADLINFAGAMTMFPPMTDAACPIVPKIKDCILEITAEQLNVVVPQIPKDMDLRNAGLLKTLEAVCDKSDGGTYCIDNAVALLQELEFAVDNRNFENACQKYATATPCVMNVLKTVSEEVAPNLVTKKVIDAFFGLTDTMCKKDPDTGKHCGSTFSEFDAAECAIHPPDANGVCRKGCQPTHDGKVCMFLFDHDQIPGLCTNCYDEVLSAVRNMITALEDSAVQSSKGGILLELGAFYVDEYKRYVSLGTDVYYASDVSRAGLCAMTDQTSAAVPCHTTVDLFSAEDIGKMNEFLIDASYGSPLLVMSKAFSDDACVNGHARCQTKMMLGVLQGTALQAEAAYAVCEASAKHNGHTMDCELHKKLAKQKLDEFMDSSAHLCSPTGGTSADTCLEAIKKADKADAGFYSCVNDVFTGKPETDECKAKLKAAIPQLGCCGTSLLSQPLASLPSFGITPSSAYVTLINELTKDTSICSYPFGTKEVKKTLSLDADCSTLAEMEQSKAIYKRITHACTVDIAAGLGLTGANVQKVEVAECAANQVAVTFELQALDDATTDAASKEFDEHANKETGFPTPQTSALLHGASTAAAPKEQPRSHPDASEGSGSGMSPFLIVGVIVVVLAVVAIAVFLSRSKSEYNHGKEDSAADALAFGEADEMHGMDGGHYAAEGDEQY